MKFSANLSDKHMWTRLSLCRFQDNTNIQYLFSGTKGDVDISDECSESPSQVCPRTNVPEEFPGNADEYAEFCK